MKNILPILLHLALLQKFLTRLRSSIRMYWVMRHIFSMRFPSFPKFVPAGCGIEHDNGVIEDEFLYGMVTNSRSVAKLLSLSDVRWDDGLFEVTLIRKPGKSDRTA